MAAVGILATAAIHPLAGLAQPPREAPRAASAPTAPSAAVAQFEQTIQSAIARAEPSVVAISRSSTPKADADRGLDVFNGLREATKSEPPVVAAGVVIDPTGLVLTQYLAVHDGDEHFVTTTDRKTYAATIRAADARSGLAILAIQSPSNSSTASPLQRVGTSTKATPPTFPAIPFGDADSLRKGQFVIAIGNPFAIVADGQATASWGTITNLAQKAPHDTNLNDSPGPSDDYRTTLHHLGTLIQTDARLGWSAGGGALVNLRGELIGLTTNAAAIAGHEQPAGYAIPMTAAFKRIIDTLKQGREVEYSMLGVGFDPLASEAVGGQSPALTLIQVFPGTPAAKAGLAPGDAITHVSDHPVRQVDEVQLAVGLLPPGTATTIEFRRRGQSSTAQLVTAKLGPAGKNVVTSPSQSWRGMRVDYATALNSAELSQALASGAFDPQGCVLVSEVQAGSDAWRAGLRAGMFVSHVGGQRVSTPAEFHAAARKLGAKFDVRVTKPIESAEETPDDSRNPK